MGSYGLSEIGLFPADQEWDGMGQGQEDGQHGEDALGVFSAPPSKAGLSQH